MRIVVINQPTNNRGDESAHKALLRRLNEFLPKVKIDVLFVGLTDEKIQSIRVNSLQNRYICIRNWWRWYGLTELQRKGLFLLTFWHPTTISLIFKILRADIVLCAPGGINMGGFQSWSHIYQLRIAKLLRKPIIYWGRSIGPFPEVTKQNRRFKQQSVKLLRYFRLTTLRDQKSVGFANELGVESHPVIDSAFLYGYPRTDISSVEDELTDDYIVLVPNMLTWHYRYKTVDQSEIDSFWLSIIGIAAKHYPTSRIVMLPQTFGGDNGDGYDYFCKLRQQADNKSIYVLPDTYDSDVQQQIISKSKLVIGARYHTIVFAVNNGVPFISINYEHKMRGMLEMIGGLGQMLDIENVWGNGRHNVELLSQFDNLLSNVGEADYELMCRKAHQIADDGFKLLTDNLKV